MTNQDYYQSVLGMSMSDIMRELDKYCRGIHSCITCKIRRKMLTSPKVAGQSCFAYWLTLEHSETSRDQDPVPSSPSLEPEPVVSPSPSSEPEPEPKPKSAVNNETSFTMLDE